ncbi:cytochrome c biogenesis protein ResB [Fictibacillus sp. FJAT-27399]|uniref:cytochrome c biogenesis protein ResB n=1 Tax=Fictibacillus sp. FJAT-27399 TaxID=1729689 RepID=UPI0007850F4C|nr:cytochrome c biogenesis protein ResB [Fictibacillus sp. FJAT-27399]
MKTIQCECGHKNPFGTEICESCGKPLSNENSRELINMRYEGSAIRSQTYNKTFIDKIWNFFSSVKVGIGIIIVILIAAAIGTIFPQEMYIPPNVDPTTYYKQEYGTPGQIFYLLGFHNLYGSWWFLLLLAALGISLIIVSIDRGVPLYRALKHQRVTRHESFMKRQRLFAVSDHGISLEQVKKVLSGKRYRIKEDNGNILAEKNRFSRWGPYVNHTGLIIFLIGAMLRFFPDMYTDQTLWIREGETTAVPGTKTDEGQYYLKNHKFVMELYNKKDKQFSNALNQVGNEVPKNYQSNITLYHANPAQVVGAAPELKKVKDAKIKVNEPLTFGDYALYQVDFKLNEFHRMNLKLEKKSTGKSFGEIKINLFNPKSAYDLGNGYKVKMVEYFPNFKLDEDGQPTTENSVPDNPAFVFKMFTPETPKGETAFIGIRKNVEAGNNKYKMTFSGLETKNVSALTVKKDRTLPIIIVGGIIFMLGVVQGLYWNHRRIWIQQKNGQLWIAAHTNKNWFGLKKEMQAISEESGLVMPVDQSDEKSA